MPNVTGLRIRSLNSDAPRIDQIEEPHHPAVPGAVANLASLSGDQLAKMDGSEAAELVGGLIDHIAEVAGKVKGDDDDLAGMLEDGAATLKRHIAEKGDEGEDEATAEEREEQAEEEHAQESRLLDSMRALEAGRVLSKRNLDLVSTFIKALTNALTMARKLAAAGTPVVARATESADSEERWSEAIEVLDADFGEFEEGKPYIKAYCVFAKAGSSLNKDRTGRRRAYSAKAMERITEAGGYNNVLHYPRHLSDKELAEHPDGMRELRDGQTGPPAAHPEEIAKWCPETQDVRGYLYITKAATVDQYRRDVAAGFSLKQLLKLSHDARFGRGDVHLTKSGNGESVSELTDWRVASVDGANTPGLPGSGVQRQVAAADQGEDDNTMKIKTTDPRPAATPKAGVSDQRATEARIEGGLDRREILSDMLLQFWDPKRLLKDQYRQSESFTSYNEFVKAGLYGDGHQGPVDHTDAFEVLKASQVYDAVKDNQNRRDGKWSLNAATRATESVALSNEQRSTEAYDLTEREYTAACYEGKFGRSQEAIVSAGLGQITGDVKHLVAQKARANVLSRDTGALYPPLDLVVTSTESRDSIGETQRFARIQKLGANEAAQVNEGAAYIDTLTITDEEESATAPLKYGFVAELSIEVLSRSVGFNLQQMFPTMMGEACGWREYTLGWNILTGNPNLGDGTAVIAAGTARGSAATGNIVATALSYNNVSDLQGRMRRVLEYGTGTGQLRQGAAINPKHLVTADTIYNQALELFSHVEGGDPRTANRAASAIVNPGNPALTIWSLPLLDNNGTPNADDYFLLGDAKQNEMQRRVVWSGQPTPAVFVADADNIGGSAKYTNDLCSFKSRMFVTFVPTDWRPICGGVV